MYHLVYSVQHHSTVKHSKSILLQTPQTVSFAHIQDHTFLLLLHVPSEALGSATGGVSGRGIIKTKLF